MKPTVSKYKLPLAIAATFFTLIGLWRILVIQGGQVQGISVAKPTTTQITAQAPASSQFSTQPTPLVFPPTSPIPTIDSGIRTCAYPGGKTHYITKYESCSDYRMCSVSGASDIYPNYLCDEVEQQSAYTVNRPNISATPQQTHIPSTTIVAPTPLPSITPIPTYTESPYECGVIAQDYANRGLGDSSVLNGALYQAGCPTPTP